MNSTPTPNAIESHNAPIARADEQLAHAHKQIARADEELARLSDQLAKMERDAARPPPAEPESPPRRPALRILVGMPLAACIVVATLVMVSSNGGGAKLVLSRWAPQLVSTLSLAPGNAALPAQPAPPIVQVAAAEETPPQATPLAQSASQEAAPTVAAALADHAQLLQTITRDLANLERSIEQLKANQQQMVSQNSKAIEELKASQEEIQRVLARVSEQTPSKTLAPPTQRPPTLRKPERTLQSPYARARPRIPREWIYDDEW